MTITKYHVLAENMWLPTTRADHAAKTAVNLKKTGYKPRLVVVMDDASEKAIPITTIAATAKAAAQAARRRK